jgi:protein-disulfide isomerase
MGLIGIIVGYGVATVKLPAMPVANVPSAPTAPAPTPTPTPEPPPAGDVPDVDPSTDHIRGDANAKISVIEYSDFECPFCKRHHPTMKQLFAAYENKDVNWVFRDFPLSFHANAQKQGEAAECAAEIGGNDMFWKYHDAIFERTTSGGTGFALDALVPLAKELGMNEARFKTCLDSGKYAQEVQDDMSGGSAAGVRGTPGTILLNNETGESKNISGAVPFETFKSALDAMLAS